MNLESLPSRTQRIIEDYQSLETAEDRLTWILERPSDCSPFPAELMTPERRVPECISGLWITGYIENEKVLFTAHSDSGLVDGIARLLCDLYSGISPTSVVTIGDQLAQVLKLEGLLTTTRKHAVRKIVRYFLAYAEQQAHQE